MNSDKIVRLMCAVVLLVVLIPVIQVFWVTSGMLLLLPILIMIFLGSRRVYPDAMTYRLCVLRALENHLEPAAERLIWDPYAIDMIKVRFRERPSRWFGFYFLKVYKRYLDFRFPGYCLGKICNSAHVDNAVSEAIRRGARQVVLAGSGYDTRPLRLGNSDVRFFEVDSRELLQMKAKRLEALDMRLFVTRKLPILVAVDMRSEVETEEIGSALKKRGFVPEIPSVIVMEEITQYIPRNCLVQVLDFTRSLSNVTVVWTYIQAKVLLEPENIHEAFDVRKLLNEIELITTGYSPTGIANFLSRFGLYLEDDFGAEDSCRLLLSNSTSPQRTRPMRLERVCSSSKGLLRRGFDKKSVFHKRK